MKLVILGSGTTVPSVERSAPGYLLEVGERQLLIDCGPGALVQLEKAKKSYRDIDAVFVTHTHPDHTADLVHLIHALLAAPGLERKKILRLYGPQGFVEFYEACIDSQVARPKRFALKIKEAEPAFDLFGIRVRTATTTHSSRIDSLAYRFEARSKAAVLSGDCDLDPAIQDLCKGADLVVLDCSYPDALKVPGHLSASQCGAIAKRANAKRLILSHLYPVERETRLEECRAVFKGDVRLAEDLMQIEV